MSADSLSYARQFSGLSPAATAAAISAQLAEKVWTIDDMQVLHQSQSPVIVAAFGMYSVPPRSVLLLSTDSHANCQAGVTASSAHDHVMLMQR